jgi:hypothetical protein
VAAVSGPHGDLGFVDEHGTISGTRKIPHPALRATFSRREKDNFAHYPSPSGRRWREAPDEGFSGPSDLSQSPSAYSAG